HVVCNAVPIGLPICLPLTLCCSSFCQITSTSAIYTLSLHDALPIFIDVDIEVSDFSDMSSMNYRFIHGVIHSFTVNNGFEFRPLDRKSTRLNSSHVSISYAVFCLKKKIKITANLSIIPKKHTIRT